jgi:hypothetical protein
MGFGAEFIPFISFISGQNARDMPAQQEKLDAIGDAFGVDERYTIIVSC